MALTVAVSMSSPLAIADAGTNFVVTVTNTGPSAVTLSSLSISVPPGCSSSLSQPVYLTPNVPVGVGNPVLAASGSASYGFGVVLNQPNFPGTSPNNAPGGAAPGNPAEPANCFVLLTATAQASDGSVSSGSVLVPVLSAMAPFPTPEGGALQFSQGSNFINGLFSGLV